MNDMADLRATINALQVECAAAGGRMEETGGSTVSLIVSPRISAKGSDSLSFIDGCLEQKITSRYSVVWTVLCSE